MPLPPMDAAPDVLVPAPPAPAACAGTVPDALAPPPRHPRFPLVDGMRAIAVLGVVLVHVAGVAGAMSGSPAGRLLAHANIGVTIFFLISGFLLYRPFIAHRGGGPAAPRVAEYAKRRCLRILPAYWLVLTIIVLVPGAPGLGPTPAWPMYTLTQTLPIYAGPSCSARLFGCGLAQTWSLGAEATFYLALPLYALVVERLTRRLRLRPWVATQAAALAALSAASIWVQFGPAYPAAQWVGWTVTGTVFWFALGMGLAVLSVAADASPRAERVMSWIGRRGGALWAAAIGGYVLLCAWLAPTPFVSGAGRLVVNHLAFGLISLLLLAPVVAGDGRRRAPARIAGAPAMAWLGLISYGIFLWHFPVVLRLGSTHGTAGFVGLLAATLAISVACAAASYYGVERPALALKYRRLVIGRGATGGRAHADRGSASGG